MDIIRKPHNLVTSYWDDCVHFLELVEAIEPQVIAGHKYISPEDKRPIRYAILSSFLFLEAFINAEYFQEMGHVDPKNITPAQKRNLDRMLIETNFEDKWSKWIEDFSYGTIANVKGSNPFQQIKKLKDWRNHLTHYKLHDLMLVANDVETVENAKEACQIARNTVIWYYEITQKINIPEWIVRDVL